MQHRKTEFVFDKRIGKMVPVKRGREVVIPAQAKSHWRTIAYRT